MNKFIRIFLIIIIFSLWLFLNGCENKGSTDVDMLIPDSISLQNISSPFCITSNSNNIFIYDLQTQSINKIRNKRVVERYKSLGKGPGEYKNISDIKCINNKLVVLDRFLMRILIFDTNFNFINSFNLNTQPNTLCVSKNRIYVNTSLDKYLIYKYDYNGKLIDKFIKNQDSQNPNKAIQNYLVMDINENTGNLVIGYYSQNKIIVISKDGKIKNKYNFKVNNPKIEPSVSKSPTRISSSTGTIYCASLVVKDGNIIICSGGGFKGNQRERERLDNMKYYLLTKNMKNDINNFIKFRLDLPSENMLGYKISKYQNKLYFISPTNNKIYYKHFKI